MSRCPWRRAKRLDERGVNRPDAISMIAVHLHNLRKGSGLARMYASKQWASSNVYAIPPVMDTELCVYICPVILIENPRHLYLSMGGVEVAAQDIHS